MKSRGVGLVDRVHDVLADWPEALRAAVVVVDHARGGLGARHDDVVLGRVLDADRLAVVVVEERWTPGT